MGNWIPISDSFPFPSPSTFPLRPSQPEISEFVWNSLPVLLGAIEADRPSTATVARRRRRQRSGGRDDGGPDRKRVDHATALAPALFHTIPCRRRRHRVACSVAPFLPGSSAHAPASSPRSPRRDGSQVATRPLTVQIIRAHSHSPFN